MTEPTPAEIEAVAQAKWDLNRCGLPRWIDMKGDLWQPTIDECLEEARAGLLAFLKMRNDPPQPRDDDPEN